MAKVKALNLIKELYDLNQIFKNVEDETNWILTTDNKVLFPIQDDRLVYSLVSKVLLDDEDTRDKIKENLLFNGKDFYQFINKFKIGTITYEVNEDNIVLHTSKDSFEEFIVSKVPDKLMKDTYDKYKEILSNVNNTEKVADYTNWMQYSEIKDIKKTSQRQFVELKDNNKNKITLYYNQEMFTGAAKDSDEITLKIGTQKVPYGRSGKTVDRYSGVVTIKTAKYTMRNIFDFVNFSEARND